MSGTIQIAVRTNDGTKLLANGYTRSAYDVFSYISLFAGDDEPAKTFMREWENSSWGKPDRLQPLEYGLFIVDFITKSIVVDGDEDVGIDYSRSPDFNGQFMEDCIAAGRVTLRWRNGRRDPLKVSPELARRWFTEDMFIHGDKEFGLSRDHIVPMPEMLIDFTPWQVRCHGRTEEGRRSLFEDIRSCGFEVDSALWKR